jgi:hypothetical protein
VTGCWSLRINSSKPNRRPFQDHSEVLKTKILDQSDMKGCLVTFVNSTKAKHYFPTNTGKYLPIEVFPEEGESTKSNAPLPFPPGLHPTRNFGKCMVRATMSSINLQWRSSLWPMNQKKTWDNHPTPHRLQACHFYGNTMSLYDFGELQSPACSYLLRIMAWCCYCEESWAFQPIKTSCDCSL